MNKDQLPDCLGCSDESSRRAVVFPNAPVGDTRTESPIGLYADRAWWCRPCWTYQDPFDRFHLLYGQRLRSYTRKKLSHLSFGQREGAVDEILAEAMEALWKQRETLKKPERAMYRMVERMVWRRFPLDQKEAPAPLLGIEEITEDPIDALVDRILVEEELAKLPEKERRYLYEHKALGETAQHVAAYYGVSKGTVTQSVRRGLEKMRPAFKYMRFLPGLMEFVRMTTHWLSK
ncbi:sigma-70 family RNA polymerase sigma factor [Streptomyces murinus]|uniref:RNA polymerase sigma factor n=1 Tax=Streptomyces murinus TaxID=33900 RepID=UPI002E0E61E2|nr:sigma-70 family RNA polymerase sigma factor [Streptomyces murinus]